MLIQTLQTLYARDLHRLADEISLYKHESNLWKIEKNISNSAGNLCLHLIGNLNTYIGAELGKSGYVRYRELEFSSKNILREELMQKIQATKDVIQTTLSRFTDEDLQSEYSMLVFEKKTSIAYFLIHLTTHLAYHIGQINYHRRLIDL